MSDENRKSDNCGYNCLICAAVMRPERQRRLVTVKTVMFIHIWSLTLYFINLLLEWISSHTFCSNSPYSLCFMEVFYIYCFSFKMFLLSSFLLFHFIVPSIYIFVRFFFCVFISLPSFYCSYFCSLSLALTRRKCAVHITSDLLTDFTFSESG